MAYRKEKHRILAGSLNLLPPGEKIPEEDALALQNFRVDQAGQLRSRSGLEHQSGYLAGEFAHTLFRQSPNRRYLGNGGFLYRSEGINAYTNIYSGFDGQPLGMATMQGKTWIMNPSKQGFDDGDTFKNWIAAAPTSAPTPAAGAQATKTLATFEPSEAWRVTQPNGNDSGGFEVAVTVDGTVDVTHNSTTVSGGGTSWDATMIGDRFRVAGDAISYRILLVLGPETLVLDTAYTDSTKAAAGYEIYHVEAVFAFETSAISGDRLHIACNPPGAWRADLALNRPSAAAGDFGIDGRQEDADKFRLWLQLSDPTALESITLAVDVNTGGFDLDYYEVTIPGSALQQTAFGWTQIEVRRKLDAAGLLAANPDFVNLVAQLNDPNLDPVQRDLLNQSLATLRASLLDGIFAFTRHTPTPGKDWSSAVALRITVQVTDACDVSFDTWDVVGGLDGALEGEYSYFVTFDSDAGHETNPSPESATLTLDKQGATLTGVPKSTDAQVTKRHIYRAGGPLDGAYRVGTIPDNVTTTYTDTLSDEDAQTRNTRLAIDHDPPPAAIGLVAHLGRLMAFNTAAHPGRYWWTPTGQPWFFPGADDETEGNWQDTGEDTDELLGATSHGRLLRLYKARSIVRLDGNPDQSDPEETSSTVGAVGPKAICKIGGGLDAFCGAEGIYRFNGEAEEKLSGKIDPIFRGEFTTLSTVGGVADIVVAPLNGAFKRNCVLEHINGRLYFSYPSGAGPLPDITLVCHLETMRWYHHALDVANNGAGGFSALYYEGQDRSLVGALSTDAGAAVYILESGTTDDGNAIPLIWHSRYNDQGVPDNEKVYADLVLVFKTGDQNGTTTLGVDLYFDNGASSVQVGFFEAGERTRQVFPLNGGLGLRHKNMALRISGDATTECIIYEAYIHWYVEARAGRSFDTGVVDLGSALVKQLDKMELEVTAVKAGALNWVWYGDLPGGSIKQRVSGTVAIDGTRQNLPVVLPVVHEGRKLRLVMTADVEFQVHALRARVLEVGEYVDGSAGDVWQSKEVTYGGS